MAAQKNPEYQVTSQKTPESRMTTPKPGERQTIAQKNRKRQLLTIGVVAGLLFLLYLPVLRWLLDSWINDPYYSHGFLVTPVSAFFIWRRLRKTDREERAHRNAGIGVILLGLAVYILGILYIAPFISALSIIAVIAGLTLYHYGAGVTRSLLFPVAFLVFMVPLPFIEGFGFYLQWFTAQFAAPVARLIGIPVTVTGTEMSLADSTLVVGPSCSGLRSIISLLTVFAVAIYILKGSRPARTILLLMILPIAFLANGFRIVSLLLIADSYSVEAAMTYYHDISGIVFYAVAFLILVLLCGGLKCLALREDII